MKINIITITLLKKINKNIIFLEEVMEKDKILKDIYNLKIKSHNKELTVLIQIKLGNKEEIKMM